MSKVVERVLTDLRFWAGSAFYLAYFLLLANISGRPQTTALVGSVCYLVFVVVFAVVTG
jgi:hypothetical protein